MTRSTAAPTISYDPESSRGGPLRSAQHVPKETPRRRASTRQRKRTVKEEDQTSSSPAAKKKRGASLKKPPPESTAVMKKESKDETENSVSCCICMSVPKVADLASINGCKHRFCFECIEKWADRENTCPLCKERFSKIDRVKKRKNGERKTKNSKRVKQRDQRSDLGPGASLEGLLASLSANQPYSHHQNRSVARLFFSNMGIPSVHLSAGQPAPFGSRRSRPSERSAGPFSDETRFSSDTDEEDNGMLNGGVVIPSISSISTLLRGFPRGSGFVMGSTQAANSGRVQVLRPMPFSHYNSSAARSYATNMSDQSAGHAENPLEIDDSDDEGEVEVIQVTRPV